MMVSHLSQQEDVPEDTHAKRRYEIRLMLLRRQHEDGEDELGSQEHL